MLLYTILPLNTSVRKKYSLYVGGSMGMSVGTLYVIKHNPSNPIMAFGIPAASTAVGTGIFYMNPIFATVGTLATVSMIRVDV